MCAMYRKWVGLAAGLLCFLGISIPAPATQMAESVRIGDYQSRTRFVLDLDGPVEFRVFTLANPYRVVVDLPEIAWRFNPRDIPKGKRITGYRFGLFQPGQSRIVIDASGPVNVSNAFLLPPKGKFGHRLVIDLIDTSAEAFLKAVRPPTAFPTRSREQIRQPSAPHRPDARKQRKRELPLIAIDPGHGGVDPGAQGRGGTLEKDIVLRQARELRRRLLATGRYRVVLTRNRDIFVRLRERIAIAQRAGADIFISLHADSIANRRVRGGSVYTLSEKASDREAEALAAKENKADIIAGVDLSEQSETVARILIDLRQRLTKNASVALAKNLVKNLSSTTKMLRRNHRFAGFAVLKAPEIPSVLIEMGYLSNAADERLLRSSKHRNRIAAAIVEGVDSYIETRQALNR